MPKFWHVLVLGCNHTAACSLLVCARLAAAAGECAPNVGPRCAAQITTQVWHSGHPTSHHIQTLVQTATCTGLAGRVTVLNRAAFSRDDETVHISVSRDRVLNNHIVEGSTASNNVGPNGGWLQRS